MRRGLLQSGAQVSRKYYPHLAVQALYLPPDENVVLQDEGSRMSTPLVWNPNIEAEFPSGAQVAQDEGFRREP